MSTRVSYSTIRQINIMRDMALRLAVLHPDDADLTALAEALAREVAAEADQKRFDDEARDAYFRSFDATHGTEAR